MSNTQETDASAQQQSPPPSAPDDADARLRTALRLPAESRRVAEWLFDDHERPFHTTGLTASPESFKKAFNFVGTSRMQPVANAVPAMLSQAEPVQTMMYVLFIPADVSHGVTLGYTFNIGFPLDEGLLPFRGVLRSSFMLVGRFAFDPNQLHLLVYMNAMSANDSLLCSMDWPQDNHRTTTYFSVPPEEYNFFKLPSRILGITVNDEYTLHARPTPRATVSQSMVTPFSEQSPQIRQNQDPSPMLSDGNSAASSNRDWHDDDVTALHPYLLQDFGIEATAQESCRDTLEESTCSDSWSTSSGSHTEAFGSQQDLSCAVPERECDHQVPEQYPGKEIKFLRSGSSDTFDLSPLGNALSEIGTMVLGDYYSPVITKGITGSPSSGSVGTVVGHLHLSSKPGDADDMKLLRTFAARSYYGSTMGVSADMRLLDWDDQDGEKDSRSVQDQARPVRSSA